MKKIFFDCGTRDATASAGLLVLRVCIGTMMLVGHGLVKLEKYADLKDKWAVPNVWPLSHLSPPLSLICTLGAEIGAAAFLIFGLMTRPAAFVLGFAMTVAAFQVHAGGPWFMGAGDGPKEPALLYLIPAIVLIITGGGSYSLDALISKEKRRRW